MISDDEIPAEEQTEGFEAVSTTADGVEVEVEEEAEEVAPTAEVEVWGDSTP